MTARRSLQLYLWNEHIKRESTEEKQTLGDVKEKGANILVRNVLDHQRSARVFALRYAVNVELKLPLVFWLNTISIVSAAPHAVIRSIIRSGNLDHRVPSVDCMAHLSQRWKSSTSRREHGLPVISSGRWKDTKV
jgi:hypothetical protein